MGGGCSLELVQSLIESIAAVREQNKLCQGASWCWQGIHALRGCFCWNKKHVSAVQRWVNTSEMWSVVLVHLYSGGLVSVETGVLRLTREWRAGIRRGERNSAWQSGRLTERISAVHSTSSGWSAWERKKLFFLKDKPCTKVPHELIPVMPE